MCVVCSLQCRGGVLGRTKQHDYKLTLARLKAHFSHGRRGRGVRYPGRIINANHVSQARVQSLCAHHVISRAEEIVNLTLLSCQRLSQGVGALTRAPETFRTAGVVAAYDTLARSPTRIMQARPSLPAEPASERDSGSWVTLPLCR